jgi:hypothetical protein
MADQGSLSDDAAGRVRTLNTLRVVFSALAVGLIIFGLYTMRETSRSRGWVTVEGKVIGSRITEFTTKGGRTYRPMVIYAYSDSGARFMSTRIAFRSLASSRREDAAQVAARYPVGSTVQVFHDPQDPEQAVLERGNNPWLPIIAGGGFSVLAVWMRILRRRTERRRGRTS